MQIHLKQHSLKESRNLKENQKEAMMEPILRSLEDIDHIDKFYF